MRKFSAIVLIGTFVLAASALAEDEPRRVLEQASQRYDEGKFAEARELYLSLVSRDRLSANLFYNLGNVEYRLGERGRAILNYERALALEPSHPEAMADLQFVRELAGARTARPRPWQRAFPPWRGDVFAIAATSAAWIAIFAFTLLFLNWNRRAVAILGTLSILGAAYFGVGTFHVDQQRSRAIVITKATQPRMAPAENSAVLDTLPAGSELHLLFERGPWSYCSLPDARTGWVPSATIERVEKTAS